MEKQILTPENSPDHETVGHQFRGWGGIVYFCDSYDPACGFWMTPLPGQRDELFNEEPKRKNVSERAIGRTFHKI